MPHADDKIWTIKSAFNTSDLYNQRMPLLKILGNLRLYTQNVFKKTAIFSFWQDQQDYQDMNVQKHPVYLVNPVKIEFLNTLSALTGETEDETH